MPLALNKIDKLGVTGQPYGRKGTITKLSKDLVPAAIEGIADMDGMETTWVIVFDPLSCGMDGAKSPLGLVCRSL